LTDQKKEFREASPWGDNKGGPSKDRIGYHHIKGLQYCEAGKTKKWGGGKPRIGYVKMEGALEPECRRGAETLLKGEKIKDTARLWVWGNHKKGGVQCTFTLFPIIVVVKRRGKKEKGPELKGKNWKKKAKEYRLWVPAS